MTMTREYFENNVIMMVELEDEFGKHRATMTNDKVDEYIRDNTDEDCWFSDLDICCKQTDDKVRRFLNFVDYNTYHNPSFKGLGFYSVMDKAFGVEFN